MADLLSSICLDAETDEGREWSDPKAELILQAIKENDPEKLSTAEIRWHDVALPTQLNPFDKELSSIMLASHYGHAQCVQTLINMKVDPFRLNIIYKRALLLASLGGHQNCVRILSRHALFRNKIKHKELFEIVVAIECLDFDHVQNVLDGCEDDNDCDRTWIQTMDGSNVMSFIILSGGPLNCLQSLIDKGVSVNHHDRQGFTPLMSAIIAGSEECVHFFIQNRSDINLKDKKDSHSFRIDRYYDERFKENKIDDLVHGDRKSSLMISVIVNNVQCVKLLLNNGADVDLSDEGGFTALMHAAYNKNSECLKEILCFAGEKTIQKLDSKLRSALMHAAYAGDVTCVKLLLKAKADRYGKDCFKRTPFMAAVISNVTRCAEILLKFQAEIDAKDLYGKSSLMRSAALGNVEMLELLVKKIQNPLHVRREDATTIFIAPLFYAVTAGATSCVDVLLQNACDVNCRTSNGETPLMRACVIDSSEIFYLLIGYGANMNAVVKKTKYNVLMWALNNGLDKVEYLLTHGVNVNHCNSKRETALILACQQGNIDCVKLLVKHGADINAVDVSYESALVHAANKKHLDCFEFLLNEGANLDLVNKWNQTIVFTAISNNNCKFLELLIANGSIFEERKLKPVHWKGFKHIFCPSYCTSMLITMMKATIFKWSWYPQDITRLPFCALMSGISPGIFSQKGLRTHEDEMINTIRLKSSPLLSAFIAFKTHVMSYLLANLYFTWEDYTTITSTKFQTALQKLPDFGGRYLSPLFKINCENVSTKPWKLQTLSFVTISSCITHSGKGAHWTRAEQVDCLPIPEKFKVRLKFQGPLSKLCPSHWCHIGQPPDCDGGMQDLLDLSAPLWPLPQCLVPCKESCSKCHGLGFVLNQSYIYK